MHPQHFYKRVFTKALRMDQPTDRLTDRPTKIVISDIRDCNDNLIENQNNNNINNNNKVVYPGVPFRLLFFRSPLVSLIRSVAQGVSSSICIEVMYVWTKMRCRIFYGLDGTNARNCVFCVSSPSNMRPIWFYLWQSDAMTAWDRWTNLSNSMTFQNLTMVVRGEESGFNDWYCTVETTI